MLQATAIVRGKSGYCKVWRDATIAQRMPRGPYFLGPQLHPSREAVRRSLVMLYVSSIKMWNNGRGQ